MSSKKPRVVEMK